VTNVKFLVLYASFGAGHQRAALAIRDGLTRTNPGAHVDILDYFVFTNSTVYNLVRKTYLKSIRLAPRLWGRFYHRTRHISGGSPINKMLNTIGLKNFHDYLRLAAPDAIVSTYPVPAGVLSQLKGRGLVTAPLITAITDFGLHSQWLHPNTDLYLVGSEFMKEELLTRGITTEKIFISGIPISPMFDKKLDKAALCQKFGLNPAIPTVLLMGGAYGCLTGMKSVCQRLAYAPTDLQLLIVCGQDAKMYDELRKNIPHPRNTINIYPFVDNIHELMSVSHLIVTKAGGLTVSEALARELPIVIYCPLPGVEEENTRFLTKCGAALATRKDSDELVQAILSLIENPGRLAAMTTEVASIKQHNSACRAAKKIDDLLRSPSISDFA
jgi:processive 1,2-diacylglycerol beta-glucosyltransferase